MLVVYDSLMGKTERFVQKTNLPRIKITEGLKIYEPFVLVTYTTGARTEKAVPPISTLNFLEHNYDYLIGVASSGHMNWGKDRFAKAGQIISNKYNVPLLHQFEMSGFPHDVEKFVEGVLKLYGKDIS